MVLSLYMYVSLFTFTIFLFLIKIDLIKNKNKICHYHYLITVTVKKMEYKDIFEIILEQKSNIILKFYYLISGLSQEFSSVMYFEIETKFCKCIIISRSETTRVG